MDNKYPNKTEILKKKPKFIEGTIEIITLWKKLSFKKWKTTPNWIKISELEILITILCNLYNKETPKIKYHNLYLYNKKTIYIDRFHPSIISTLHETAHHLFGPDETKAVIWSIWLFKTCFPLEYSKLKWDKHLLHKK